MFLGEYRHSIDNKNRLTVPVRYRDLMEEGAYIMRGLDRNLMVLTTKAFEAISQSLDQKSFTDPLTRDMRRLFFGTASRLEIDKAGRIFGPVRNFCDLIEINRFIAINADHDPADFINAG